MHMKNYQINFRLYLKKMKDCAFVEKTITNDVEGGIQSLSHSFQSFAMQVYSTVLAIAQIRSRINPITSRLYVKERVENGQAEWK